MTAWTRKLEQALGRRFGDGWWQRSAPIEVFQAGAEWALSTLAIEAGGDDGASDVHAAWRDTMLYQGRRVADERQTWEGLPDVDKGLDRVIHRRVIRAAVDRLKGG
jgi:hypothetical protein